jgi:hypothetical protein
MRWIVILSLACWIGLVAYGQELSPPEAKRVPVPRPVNVKVVAQESHLMVSWDVTPIKRVTGYEVFKKVDGDEPVFVATVEKPPCVTAVPTISTDYFVVAVDYRDNRSNPSQPVTYKPPEEKK